MKLVWCDWRGSKCYFPRRNGKGKSQRSWRLFHKQVWWSRHNRFPKRANEFHSIYGRLFRRLFYSSNQRQAQRQHHDWRRWSYRSYRLVNHRFLFDLVHSHSTCRFWFSVWYRWVPPDLCLDFSTNFVAIATSWGKSWIDTTIIMLTSISGCQIRAQFI